MFAKSQTIESFKALDNVSLSFSKGDKVGIEGNNGAGKTTLLRVLANILPPTRGEVIIRGESILPLINKNAEVIPSLTCLQNITLHGLRNRLFSNELREYIDSVRELADLDKFLYMPAKNLSSGMRNRLILSMFHANPAEIVVMDEWIGTADDRILKHRESLLANLIDSSKIFILATHRQSLLKQYCNKSIVLEKGRIVDQG